MMKLLPLFFICALVLFLSCQSKTIDEPSTPMSTAILWVDKKSKKLKSGSSVRTAKADVTITPNGKLSLHSFVKEQPLSVRRYLEYRLTKFQITKIMLDSGHIKPGRQYVQLRYYPDLADRLR